ncbi:hypothetical protein DFJ73DRAFT_828577 [Zopfochytrium polystomum]|nr:hypothetical protein DFJ73DRAFT_828577 [Zopfochytrium polystomum]
MFSNSQHDTSARPFDWWKETFMAAVKSIQNVVMVLLPWNDPVPLTRAWCVFEVFATAYTKSKFHVAMPPSVSSDFFSNLVGRPSIFYEVLAKISCTRSCATLESDRKLIFEVIDCSLPDGMAALDALVLNMIKTYHDRAMAAVADLEQGATGTVPSIPSVTLSATADSASSTDKSTEASKPAPVTNARDVAMLEAAQWSYTLARLYDDQGDHQLAEPLYVFCVDTRVSVLGQLHPSTLLAMFRRHDNLSYLGRRTEALALAQECLALREQAGCPEQDILSSKNSIANALLFLGKIKKATKLHEEILEGRTKALGESSPETLRSMNNLANAYKQLPEVEKAEHLFSQCYKLRVQYLGENHPVRLQISFHFHALVLV